MTAQDLYQMVTISDPQFSPDGRWIAHVRTHTDDESNEYNSAIWLASTGDGHIRQFTSGQRRDSNPRWSPDGRWLAFVSNRGGDNDKAQLYVIPTDGGEALQLTTMENGAGEPAWSPDGRRLAFTSRIDAEEMAAEQEHETGAEQPHDEEGKEGKKGSPDPRVIERFAYRAGTSYFDGRTAHLYVIEVDPDSGRAQGKVQRVTEEERNYGEPRWMPDGHALLARVDRKPGEDDLFYYPDVVRVPLDGSPVELLTGPDMSDAGARPSPDGQWIAYVSLPVAEYTTANEEIKCIPASGGEPRVLTAGLDAHAYDLLWTPDSRYLCFRVAERGRIDLRCVSIDGGPVQTVFSADCEILGYDLSPDARRVGFVASTDRAPWDLYIAETDATAGLTGSWKKERRLTEVNGDWLAAKALAAVEDLWFESADGTAIQGWILAPPDFDPEKQYPLVLSIHGGPHVMWSRHESTMWHEWQMLAGRGYVVFACNPRGSDGYGQDFRAALRKRWGEADLPDLMAGVEAVLARGYVDPERLAITGGSYGGFMTAWVIGHDDRFKAAVAQRGVYDLISFYSTSDIPLLTEWEFDAVPWQDPELLWKYSPLAYAEGIHTPLLLIHSENDFRAPIPAAEGLFVALRRLKRPVQMVRYPRDGHELSRSGEPKHRVDRLERIADWFDQYTKTTEGTPNID
ncbi:MAG: S9 family peptidase [Anaerolineae bacterium]